MARIVDPDALARLRGFAADRDKLALMIGVATLEWRARVAQAEASILRSTQEQREFGESLIRSAGLDPVGHEYQIDPQTGIIRELIAGVWREVL